MTHSRSRTLLASLSGLALLLVAGESFAAGPVAAHGGAMAHPAFRPGIGRNVGHHRGRNGGFWPGYVYGDGDGYYDAAPVDPGAAVPPQASGDVHYTYTYDVPWDQVHRFPPNVVPSDRPYVQQCSTQSVTVPRRGGSDQTADINIMRCY